MEKGKITPKEWLKINDISLLDFGDLEKQYKITKYMERYANYSLTEQEPTPFGSKNAPKNRMEAFYHQFADDIRLLFSLSQIDDKVGFKQQLTVLRVRVESCERLMAQDAGEHLPILPAIPLAPMKVVFRCIKDGDKPTPLKAADKKELVFELVYPAKNNTKPVYLCNDKSFMPITLHDIPASGRLYFENDVIFVLLRMEF